MDRLPAAEPARNPPLSRQGPVDQDRDGGRGWDRDHDAERVQGRDGTNADAGRRGQGTVSASASGSGPEVARPLQWRPDWPREQAGPGLQGEDPGGGGKEFTGERLF